MPYRYIVKQCVRIKFSVPDYIIIIIIIIIIVIVVIISSISLTKNSKKTQQCTIR